MKKVEYLFILFLCSVLNGKEPNLVKITAIDPSIKIDLRYATSNNFTKIQIYPAVADAYLLPFVAEKLSLVQRSLKEKGLGLKIWDAYRPLSGQWKLWEIFPDERYVTNPAKNGVKGCRHPRGTTVDVTLIHLSDGKELLMPTEFDDFSEKAHADYLDLSEDLLRNRKILRIAMEQFGFKAMPYEWWHFDISGWENYPVLDVDFEVLAKN